ncbi:hypothetical protein FRB94_002852 [Tulasnella sp. JGI-2019a]|nr:hypothetical protein FRB93_011319 [Tulasnella sp. JGI-2019a]KAG9003861.1 hypothetical protein FRB94_002852 [Tulasnella sp. JGI-2019a]
MSGHASGMRTASKSFNSYDALLQFVLQRRALNTTVQSLGVTTILLISASYARDSPGWVFQLATLFWCLPAFVAGVLPPLILQNALLGPSKAGYATRMSQLRSLATAPSTYITALVYVSSAAAMALAFVFLSAPATKISVFKPTTLYPWHLNERFVFLLGGNILLGAVLAARSVYMQTTVIPWQPAVGEKWWKTLILHYFRFAAGVLKLTIITMFIYTMSYLALRKSLFRIGLFVFKPFVHNFLRSRLWVITPYVCWRLVQCNLATAFSIYFAETCLTLSASEHVMLTQFASNPTNCLIDGITSTASRGYSRHFAFAELSEIAQNPKFAARRKDIFSDIRNTSSSSGKYAWGVICRETLLLLGKDHRTLATRGKPQALATTARTGAPITQHVTMKSTSTLKQAEYAVPHRSTQDQMLDLAASSLQSAEQVLASRAPDIYNKGSVSLPISSAHSPSTGGVREAIVSVVDKAQHPSTLVPSWATVQSQLPTVVRSVLDVIGDTIKSEYHGFVDETIRRKVSVALPNAALDALAIQALCHLTAASLLEDPYGVVQKDIPRILEALLLFKQTLAAFQQELNDPVCDDLVEPIRHALGTGLHTIVVTFSDRLSAFRFAPATARRLQELIDHAG